MGATDGRPGGVYVAAQMLLLGALALSARHPRRGLASALGLLAMGAGGAVMALAASRLGRRLRADPMPAPDAELRTDGAYAFARHPIYTGLLTFAAGLALLRGGWRTSGLWVALLVVLTRKTRLEEQLLIERFPEYAAYAERTPRFLPRLPRC